MSFGDAQDAKERVRKALNIVDVVGAYLPLRRQGREFVALCPWHNDSKPSLKVQPERQTWKCWPCGIGGDIFSFVMKHENFGFREALELLAEKAGIELTSHRPDSKVVPGSPDDKKTLLQAVAWAEEQFHECLLRSPVADVAWKYVEERGITPATVEQFRLGFCPDAWDWLIDRAKGTPFGPAVLDAAGLLVKSSQSGKLFDRFRGRVIFPIHDAQGRVIAFGGRVLPQFATDRTGKYINSPESRLFSKSDTLYALHLAKHHLASVETSTSDVRKIVVVEGYTDVIMCHQFGVRNVVAALGTALNQRHIRVLRRYADQVLLLLDGDEAGQKRTNELLDMFVAEQVDLRVLTLPEEFDPCEFLQERGEEPFRALLGNALDALEHKLQTLTKGIDLFRDTHASTQALDKMLSTLSKVAYDSGDTVARLREHQMLARLARIFGVPEGEIRARVTDHRRSQRQAVSSSTPSVPTSQPLRLMDLSPREAELLELLTLHGELMGDVVNEIVPEDLTSETAQVLFGILDRLFADGETLTFESIMNSTEDPAMQSLFVQLEERASAKEVGASEPARGRLAQLLEDFQSSRADRERRKKQAAIEARTLDQKEEQEVFMQLLAETRARHGFSAPTDG